MNRMLKNPNNTKQGQFNIMNFILLPKLFLIITVVLIMWVILILSGPLFGVFEPDFTGLSPSIWLIIISALILAFIIIDIILYATPHFFTNQPLSDSSLHPMEFPEVEQRFGKQVYEFTYPVGSKGGAFSKTYVQIEKNAILRIRNQMIKKEELGKK